MAVLVSSRGISHTPAWMKEDETAAKADEAGAEAAGSAEEGGKTDADASEQAATGEQQDEAGESSQGDIDTRIKELQDEVQSLREARLRALAELENVRRIAERDVTNAREFAIQKFAKQLLDVSDNLERAIQAVPAAADHDQLSDEEAAAAGRTLMGGVQATSKELHKVFEMNQIFEFGEVGESFDPECMEAMFVMPISDDLPASTVGQVLRKGYKFKSRVLRAAQVGASPMQ